MKFKKQILIPVFLIIILSLYLFFNSTGKMNYEIPQLNRIEENKIKNLQITNSNGIQNLHFSEDVWRIGKDDYRAEISKVSEILSFLVNPELIDMVSETGNYQNYGLENNNFITLEAWTDTQMEGLPIRKLIIGNVNSTGKFTFIKLPNNLNVFTVSGDKNILLDVTENDLLDKRVTSIDISEINRIVLTISGSKYILNKTVNNNEDAWTGFNDIPVDINFLEQSLRYLSNSKFDSYIESTKDSNQGFLIKIELFGNSIYEYFLISEKIDKEYSGKSSFTDKAFTISENTGTQIIKMFNDLVNFKN